MVQSCLLEQFAAGSRRAHPGELIANLLHQCARLVGPHAEEERRSIRCYRQHMRTVAGNNVAVELEGNLMRRVAKGREIEDPADGYATLDDIGRQSVIFTPGGDGAHRGQLRASRMPGDIDPPWIATKRTGVSK